MGTTMPLIARKPMRIAMMPRKTPTTAHPIEPHRRSTSGGWAWLDADMSWRAMEDASQQGV